MSIMQLVVVISAILFTIVSAFFVVLRIAVYKSKSYLDQLKYSFDIEYSILALNLAMWICIAIVLLIKNFA